MEYRKLGRSGLTVSEIGFGAWGIGGRTEGFTSYGTTDDAISVAAVNRAIDLGINFFDTSNVYGAGHSEELLGLSLQKKRDQVIIATKAGLHRFYEEPDFSPSSVRLSLHRSLERLRCSYVDLLQLHNPEPSMLRDRPEICEGLETLKKEGKIRAHGISVKSPEDGFLALDVFDFDVVQANFNMLDIRLLKSGFLDLAKERKFGLIARTPLCFGFLAGRIGPNTQFGPGDHRAMWPAKQIRLWVDGAAEMKNAIPALNDGNQAQIALRFCLSFSGVSSVIPGILTPSEAEENAAASERGPLLASEIRAVESIHDRLDFFNAKSN